MPFLDKLTDKLGDMMKEKLGGQSSSSSHDQDTSHGSSHGGYESHGGYDSHGGYGSHGGYDPSYGGHDTRGAYDSHGGQYQQPYGGQPPLPPGWIQQWDPNSQRYFYIEQATGRTQREPPMMPVPGGVVPGQHYGYGHSEGGQYDSLYGSRDAHGEHKEKGSSHTGMYMAGGVAVGALGGAWAAHEYAEHEEEEAAEAAAAHGSYAAPPQDYGSTYVPPPVEGEDSDVASEREDVIEEQENVADAQEELAEASSESDREEAQEELEEAQSDLEEEQEEYEEEVEDE